MCESAEPWMGDGRIGQRVGRHPCAFLGAQHRTGRAGPSAEQPEAVTDGDERRAVVCEDAVEEAKQRRLPLGAFHDSLTPHGGTVVEPRVEVSRAAGADEELEAVWGGDVRCAAD